MAPSLVALGAALSALATSLQTSLDKADGPAAPDAVAFGDFDSDESKHAQQSLVPAMAALQIEAPLVPFTDFEGALEEEALEERALEEGALEERALEEGALEEGALEDITIDEDEDDLLLDALIAEDAGKDSSVEHAAVEWYKAAGMAGVVYKSHQTAPHACTMPPGALACIESAAAAVEQIVTQHGSTTQQLARMAWLHDRALSASKAPLPDAVAGLVGRRAEFMQSMQQRVQQLGQLDALLAAWTAHDQQLTAHAPAGAAQALAQRRAWLAEADVHAAGVLRVAEGVLQFEASRDGAFWAGGRIVPRTHFAPHRAVYEAALTSQGAPVDRAVTVDQVPPALDVPSLAADVQGVAALLQQACESLSAVYDAIDMVGELRDVLQSTSQVGELQQPLTMVNAALTDTVGLLAAALVAHAGAVEDVDALRRGGRRTTKKSGKGGGKGGQKGATTKDERKQDAKDTKDTKDSKDTKDAKDAKDTSSQATTRQALLHKLRYMVRGHV